MPKRHRAVVDVHLLLIRDGRLLLARRRDTGFEDGRLHLPAGHVEDGESVLAALCREAAEELGIRIDPDQARLAHVMHRQSGGGRMATFFAVRNWEGVVMNAEPAKCSELVWVPLERLPPDTVGYAREAVDRYLTGAMFSVDGWRAA